MKYTIELDTSRNDKLISAELDCSVVTLGERTTVQYATVGSKLCRIVKRLNAANESSDVTADLIPSTESFAPPLMRFRVNLDTPNEIVLRIIAEINSQWRGLLCGFINTSKVIKLIAEIEISGNRIASDEPPF